MCGGSSNVERTTENVGEGGFKDQEFQHGAVNVGTGEYRGRNVSKNK